MLRVFRIISLCILGLTQPVFAEKPVVIHGQIDLRYYDFSAHSSLKLNGEWAFYDGTLLRSYPNTAHPEPKYIKVPGSWNHAEGLTQIRKGIGYGTYRLLLIKKPGDEISLLFNDIASSYKVWINGELKLEAGKTDTFKAGCQPFYGKKSLALTPSDSILIDIEVANYCQHKGGIKSFVGLITSNQVNLQHERESLRTYFCLGIIIIMGIYHLALFVMNKKDRSSLNFGLFCFTIFLFLIFRSRLVYFFYPDFDWNLGNKIEFVSQFLSVPLFYKFFSGAFPRQFKNLFQSASWVISLILIAWVLFTDMLHFSLTLDIFHLVIIAYIILVMIGIARAVSKREVGINIIFPGFLVFMASLVNDILHVQNIINTSNLLIFGILGFIISQAIFLARISGIHTRQIVALSENLTRLNQSLESFVPSDFLKMLHKNSITEVELGDNTERELTIMFSDVRAFTSISEKLSPTESFMFINDYFKHMAPIIRRHNGFIDKYLGDGIMALFPNSADDALLAGKAMMEELITFNHKNARLNKPQIAIGIGLHTGSCILGTVGEPRRMDTTVVADSVNLAARIEALTKFYQTPFIISEETRNRVSSDLRVNMRFIGEAKVKGKSIKTSLYKVFLDHKYDVTLLDTFDLAIKYFYEKRFEEAAELFKGLSETEVRDGILDFYIQYSEKYAHQTLPEDWKTFQTFDY